MSGSGDLRFSVSLDDLPEVEDEKKPAAGWDHVGGRLSVLPGEIEVEHAAPEAEPNIEIVHVRDGGRGNHEIEELQQQVRGREGAEGKGRTNRLRRAAAPHATRAAGRSFRIIRTPSPKSTTRNWKTCAKPNGTKVRQRRTHTKMKPQSSRGAQIAVYCRNVRRNAIDLKASKKQGNELPGAGFHSHSKPAVSGDPVEAWIATAGKICPKRTKTYLRERRSSFRRIPIIRKFYISAARIAEKRYGLTPGSAEYHEFLDHRSACGRG